MWRRRLKERWLLGPQQLKGGPQFPWGVGAEVV
jgi:hypothetical protein